MGRKGKRGERGRESREREERGRRKGCVIAVGGWTPLFRLEDNLALPSC